MLCNGGSPTSQQALAAGVPLIGIASNLDQFLNMHGVVAAGAGALLRADRFSESALRRGTEALLNDAGAAAAAKGIARQFAAYQPGARLRRAGVRPSGSDPRVTPLVFYAPARREPSAFFTAASAAPLRHPAWRSQVFDSTAIF